MEQWLDQQRGITLREKLPSGASINAKMTAKENVNGREAERWEVTMTSVDGKTQSGTRWYDVELGITITRGFPERIGQGTAKYCSERTRRGFIQFAAGLSEN